VLGILLAVPLSHLWQGNVDEAVKSAIEFLKVVVYYFLLTSLVDTPARFRWFLRWIAILAAVMAVMSLLNFYDVLSFSDLKELNEKTAEGTVKRLRGPGKMFGDPNDVCALLVVGTLLCLCGLDDRRLRLARWAWLAPLGLCGFAAYLTQSRGGFLGLLAGLGVPFSARFGWKKSLLLAPLS